MDSDTKEIVKSATRRGVTLMLRRVLPEWDFERMMAELVDYCPGHGIGEVIFMVNPEEFSEGILPLERVREYVELLKVARERLNQAGVLMSINVWATLHHMDRGRNTRDLFPDWTWMVDQNGRQSDTTPCPLCDGWVRYIADTYALYAESSPHILWVDDDFRYHNHMPLDWGGCFCELHLTALGKRMERRYTREQALAAVLAPGKPSIERKVWLEILGESMLAAAVAIEQAVHAVSPQTRLGLMTSIAANHSAEGRPWHELLKALSGPYTPVARPHYGPYSDGAPREYAVGFLAMKETSSCYPESTLVCPEVENIPFTIFSKSSAGTALQISTSVAAGHSNVTLELYDFVANPSDLDPSYAGMLDEKRPFWDALAKHCPAGGVERGLGVLRSDELSASLHTTTRSRYNELVENTLDALASITLLGVPLCYDKRPVNIGFGQVWRTFDPRRIEKLLSGGVILDGVAARTLCDMGYSGLIGVEADGSFSNMDTSIGAEKIIEPAFKHPLSNGIMTTTYGYGEPCVFEKLQCLEDALKISVFLNQHRDKLWPSTVLYENSLGGKVAVLAVHFNGGMRQPGFTNWDRKAEIEAIVKWLGRGTLDMFVRGCGPVIPYGRDLSDKVIVSLACLAPDGMRDFDVVLSQGSRKLTQAFRVQYDGSLEPASGSIGTASDGFVHFRPQADLSYLEVGVWVIKKE